MIIFLNEANAKEKEVGTPKGNSRGKKKAADVTEVPQHTPDVPIVLFHLDTKKSSSKDYFVFVF